MGSGFTLIAMGLMLGMGVAELLDPTLRRFAIALRFAGMGIAGLGAVLAYWA